MSVEARVESLMAKHKELEGMIEVENHRPLPDEAALHALKRQKLKIKDEIKRIPH